MEINSLIKECHRFIKELFPDVETEFTLSWGNRGEFETFDPFTSVRLDKKNPTKIVIEYTVATDIIWIIDFLKGMIFHTITIYKPKIINRISSWKFATLISLLIIPSTVLNEGTKTRYEKRWLNAETMSLKGSRRHDYQRWVQIFKNYSRVSIIELFRNFIDQLDSVDIVEHEFNNYVPSIITSFYTDNDVQVMNEAMKLQILEAKKLETNLPLSKKQVYKSLHRLSFHLNQFYLHHPEKILLQGVYFDTNRDFIHALKVQSYFENTDTFLDLDVVMVKYYFPFTAITKVITSSQFEQIQPIFLRTGNRSAHFSPNQFNPQTHSWESIFNLSTHVYKLQMGRQSLQDKIKLKKEELFVLRDIMRSRTTDFRKLATRQSQTETKKIIKKIKKTNQISSYILIRPPIDLPTVLFIIPTTDWKEIDVDNLLSTLDKNQYVLTKQIEQLIAFSFPNLYLEHCMKLKKESNGKYLYQSVVFVWITAISEDINRLKEELTEFYYATCKNKPGTIYVIPAEEFDDEKSDWVFDFDQFNKWFQ